MITQIHCPHCGLPMEDDGSLAGQLVMCPRCSGQMQMPAFIAGAVASPPVPAPPPAFPSAAISSTSDRRRVRKESNAVALVVALAFLLGCIVWIAVAVQNGASTPAVGTAHDEGYALGHEAGNYDRNNGHGYNPDAKFEWLIQGDHLLRDSPDGSKQGILPKKGSKDFGDYRAGYHKGYHDGFSGR